MFVVWGAMHGIAMVIHRIWKQLNFTMNKYLAWFITFNFINITWVFFRAKDLDSAIKVLNGMFYFEQIATFTRDSMQGIGAGRLSLVLLALMFLLIFSKNSNELIRYFKPNKVFFIVNFILFYISFLYLNRISEFLYFNF